MDLHDFEPPIDTRIMDLWMNEIVKYQKLDGQSNVLEAELPGINRTLPIFYPYKNRNVLANKPYSPFMIKSSYI